MSDSIVETPSIEGFESVETIEDPETGLKAICAIHSTSRGPAFGGIRRHAYQSDADAMHDVLRLAEGMSLKLALAELPAGGGKTVLFQDDAIHDKVLLRYQALGRAIDGMDGRYVCGPDVGTGIEEIEALRSQTKWVNPPGNEPNKNTARGVMAGAQGVMKVLGSSIGKSTAVVQGLGGIGSIVAKTLTSRGATVYGADPHKPACDAAEALGVKIIDPAEVTEVPCDMLLPCALGGTITNQVAQSLEARAICGSANNQLASAKAGEILHERGIMYAPDFAVNVGAVTEGVLTIRVGPTDKVRELARMHISRIEGTVETILTRARDENRPSAVIAEEMARARLQPDF